MTETRRVLRDHRRERSTLVPPLAKLPVEVLDWEGTHLPENLWLGYLLDRYGLLNAVVEYDQVCDIADAHCEADGEQFLGYISDFATVPEESRAAITNAIETGPAQVLGADFRALLALYPEGPAVWLASGGGSMLSVDAVFELVRRLIRELRDSHGKLASECRLLAFRRMLMKQRLHFPPDVPDEELVSIFTQYPNVDDDSARRAQQFARVTMNAILAGSARPFGAWGAHFWTTNFTLVPCQ